MRTSVFGAAASQPFPFVEELSGKCGKVIVELVDAAQHSNYLTKQGDTLVLESNSFADEGQKTVTVKAYLEDYP